jgi:3-isopropylmalate/(R)-2-methylmalate dehydratase large subunit
MAVETGAKNGIFEPDDITKAYMKGRSDRQGNLLLSDPEARYDQEIKIVVDNLEPQVALPHSPDNVKPISEVGSVSLDQVFLGSCTNGRLDDLRDAAGLLEGEKVAKEIRFIVIPGSPSIYKAAINEGIIETLLEAGAVIGPPCCGPCLGGHMGILAEGERTLSTSNRNFVGRMGHPKSEIYLASPVVAAASAVMGHIASPDELWKME